jgi:hypothetical protein
MNTDTRDLILSAIDRRATSGRRTDDGIDWVVPALVGVTMLLVGLLIGLSLPR